MFIVLISFKAFLFFPTCQVRVVRFMSDARLLLLPPSSSLPDLICQLLIAVIVSGLHLPALDRSGRRRKDEFGNPVQEFRGRRLRRGILWSITGDLGWFCQEWNFPWPASNMMCPYCRADQMKEDPKQSFTEFRPSASWRDTILSNSQLKTKFHSHPIFKPPSVSILSVKLDWLHTVDLGAAAYLHGSLLYRTMEGLPGRNRSSED